MAMACLFIPMFTFHSSRIDSNGGSSAAIRTQSSASYHAVILVALHSIEFSWCAIFSPCNLDCVGGCFSFWFLRYVCMGASVCMCVQQFYLQTNPNDENRLHIEFHS